MSEKKRTRITINTPKKSKRQRITAESAKDSTDKSDTNSSAAASDTMNVNTTTIHVPKWKKFLSIKDNNSNNSNNSSRLSRNGDNDDFTEVPDIESEIDSSLSHENIVKEKSLTKNKKKKTDSETVGDNGNNLRDDDILKEKKRQKRNHKDDNSTKKSDTLSADLITPELKIPENASDSSNAALQYLATWYLHRQSLWKFQKVRQVWLLQHVYDVDNVPNEFFKIFLEYINDLTGKAREKTMKEAQEILDQFEKKSIESSSSPDDVVVDTDEKQNNSNNNSDTTTTKNNLKDKVREKIKEKRAMDILRVLS
ncbi:9717_t:CDS:2 [Ambispora gerdemannii]|uniref:9717_t:CDS:1 n=1 Tax=Ambispora gerdemannii TaxID=144530 RepID=A0A9N9CS00_9GLOM|nr:9717_t:CDS:2 [Ambispora gerdemannii]